MTFKKCSNKINWWALNKWKEDKINWMYVTRSKTFYILTSRTKLNRFGFNLLSSDNLFLLTLIFLLKWVCLSYTSPWENSFLYSRRIFVILFHYKTGLAGVKRQDSISQKYQFFYRLNDSLLRSIVYTIKVEINYSKVCLY